MTHDAVMAAINAVNNGNYIYIYISSSLDIIPCAGLYLESTVNDGTVLATDNQV